MFRHADTFNKPLNNWDVRKVINMKYMLAQASSFNPTLADWKLESIASYGIDGMFVDAKDFRQNMCKWAEYLIAAQAIHHDKPYPYNSYPYDPPHETHYGTFAGTNCPDWSDPFYNGRACGCLCVSKCPMT